MKISYLQVPPIGTNCYLVMDESVKQGFIVDPGGAGETIVSAAAEMGMTPVAILLTHGHYDHTGAVAELREKYPDLPVYLHPLDAGAMRDPNYLVPDIGPTVPYEEGDELGLAGLTVKVLHTPGHTPGSVTLEMGDVLFTGDTLFRGSCGRTDFPGGSFDAILASLKRLGQLEGDRKVLPGHEGLSTLEEERKSNYYMLQALNS